MPPFEEWREQQDSEEDEIRLERSEFNSGVGKIDSELEEGSENEVNEQFEKATEDKEQKVEMVEKAAENDKKAFPEEMERNGLNYHLVSSGEESALYRAEKKDGGTAGLLETEYFDKAHDFLKAHDEIKNETGAMRMFEMESLAFDLALIDAVGDKYFDDGRGAKSLEDYGKLQEYLDDPKVDKTEKAAIKEYLDEAMNGEAMRLLKSKYEEQEADKSAETQNDEETEINDEELEKIKDQLDETRRKIEKQQDFINGSAMKFDESFEKIEEALENHSLDADEIQAELSKLERATEGLEQSIHMKEDSVDEYMTDILRHQEQLGDKEFGERLLWALNQDEEALKAKRRVWAMDEYRGRVRSYIADVEDVLERIRRI